MKATVSSRATVSCEVLIVGAGLAGLSAAAQIAAHSRAEMIILERLMIGSNNPTPMTFSSVLPRFGLEDCSLGRYHRFTFHSPLGNCSSHTFDGESLVALAYQRACLSLLDRASKAGNVWMYAAAAVGLRRNGDRWQVSLNDGQEVEARLVIDASGRGLFTSRALRLSRPRAFSHCYGARLSNCAIPDAGETFFFAPCQAYGNGGGWLYPLDGGQASYGWATLGNTPSLPGRLVKENFNRALAAFEPYADWLKGAQWEHVEVGSIPIYPLRRFVYDGLLIAGDSAGQATIWTCMGSEAALEAGMLAGEAAVSALQRGDTSAKGLDSYQRRWDRQYRDLYRRNAWVAPTIWSMSETDWNRQILRQSELSPDELLARLRVNWPVPTLPQAAFVRTYDLAGRARRGLVRKLKGMATRAG